MTGRVARLPQAGESTAVRELKQDLLHAYHILDADGQSSGIAGHLTARLPEYMVPTHFERIEEIPLTPTGKADRKALPEPEIIKK